jgi:hypothetical protein
METKPAYLSKTVWMNLIIAASAFFPPVQEWVVSHPDMVMIGWSVVNILLRFVSGKEVTIA